MTSGESPSASKVVSSSPAVDMCRVNLAQFAKNGHPSSTEELRERAVHDVRMLLVRAVSSRQALDARVGESSRLFSGRPQEAIALAEDHKRLDGERLRFDVRHDAPIELTDQRPRRVNESRELRRRPILFDVAFRHE